MFSQAAVLSVAVLITLSGVWMNWRAHWYRMSAEEAMKDGKLTQDQVDLRLRVFANGSRILTLAGMGLLVVSVVIAGE